VKIIYNLKIKSSKEYEAYKKYGQASKKDVDNAFKPNTGLIIKSKKLNNAWGEFIPGKNSNEIIVNESLLKDIEKGIKGADKMLEVVIKHELTHFFDDKDGKDYPGEEGEKFEKKVYGKVIKNYKDALK